MAGSEMGSQRYTAESYLIAVMQDPIHLRRRPTTVVLEIASAAVFNFRHVLLHHHQPGSAEVLGERTAGSVVVMGVTDEDDLDVGEMVPEFLDALLNDGN